MMTISLYCQVVYLVMCYLLCFSGFGHSLEPAMYLFGSSVLDMGTNNYLTGGAKGNYYPYGIDYPGGEATGRFSNGKNAADFLGTSHISLYSFIYLKNSKYILIWS